MAGALGTPHYLFSRIYQLDLQPPELGAPALSFGNLHGEQSALRVAFQLERKATSAPNKGNIAIFNLNQRARQAIGVGWSVSLRAGYVGLNERIFVGKVGVANTQRQGPDIVTSLECMEGYTSLVASPFMRSYPPGTSIADILPDVAAAMDVDAGIARDIPRTVYPRGIVLSGSCRDVLTKLLKPLKMEANVQGGRLNILPQNAPLGTAAIVVGQDTGLIGVPAIDKKQVTFSCLLQPRLCVPGQLVQLVTVNQAAAGFMKIREVKIEGDSHDQKWNVEATCARLANAQVVPNLAVGFNYQSALSSLL